MSFDWTDDALGGACTKNAALGRARRLGLPGRGSPLGLGSPSRHDWTDDEIARLQALRLIGQSDAAIAAKLGLSQWMVWNKRRQLESAGALKRVVLPGGRRSRRPARPAVPRPAKPRPGGPLRYQTVSAELYHRCCWPMWDDLAPRPLRRVRFCEARPAALSTPYCAAHAAIAYRQDLPAATARQAA